MSLWIWRERLADFFSIRNRLVHWKVITKYINVLLKLNNIKYKFIENISETCHKARCNRFRSYFSWGTTKNLHPISNVYGLQVGKWTKKWVVSGAELGNSLNMIKPCHLRCHKQLRKTKLASDTFLSLAAASSHCHTHAETHPSQLPECNHPPPPPRPPPWPVASPKHLIPWWYIRKSTPINSYSFVCVRN